MQFELTGSNEHPYRITFEGDEIETVKAAYVEDISRRVQAGNVGSFSEFDMALGSWDEGSKAKTALFISYLDLAQKLEDFNDRTEDELIKIANETAIPDFMKDYLITRRRLGEKALELAEGIRKEGGKVSAPLPDPDEVDIDSELTRFFPNPED